MKHRNIELTEGGSYYVVFLKFPRYDKKNQPTDLRTATNSKHNKHKDH